MSPESNHNFCAFQKVQTDCMDAVRLFVRRHLKNLFEDAQSRSMQKFLRAEHSHSSHDDPAHIHHDDPAHMSYVLHQLCGWPGCPTDLAWHRPFEVPHVVPLGPILVGAQVYGVRAQVRALVIGALPPPPARVLRLAA